jgi:molybdate transport system substrate-binding protein
MHGGRYFLGVLVALSAGCGKQSPSSEAAGGARAVQKETIVVSAAASTREVVESLCKQFCETNGVEVHVNTGASNNLANQILAGAPADLFLSASEKWAIEIEKANVAEAAARLLTNDLVIAVPKGNRANVHEPGDLLKDEVKKLAVAGENVPAGMYADQSLTRLALLKRLVEAGKIVRGADVRATMSYIERGEVEAGIVYSTDIRSTRDVEAVYKFDPKLHDEIVYVLVLLKHGSHIPSTRKLYDFLQSPMTEKAFRDFGFRRLGERTD